VQRNRKRNEQNIINTRKGGSKKNETKEDKE
jgi:hypothetical protein